MRDDSGADQPTCLDGDLQSTGSPQPEADVVGEIFVAVTRSNMPGHTVNIY